MPVVLAVVGEGQDRVRGELGAAIADHRDRLAALRRASPLFSMQIHQRRIVDHRTSEEPFQARVLALKALHPLGFADLHAAILGLPLVYGRIADSAVAAQFNGGDPASYFFKSSDDPVFVNLLGFISSVRDSVSFLAHPTTSKT